MFPTSRVTVIQKIQIQDHGMAQAVYASVTRDQFVQRGGRHC